MESNKLGKNIQDWAASLGFTLPDGSAPPANHFALLTATPHRRQLWEALVESIQPRQKIEKMRKQILVAKLQEKKKSPKNSTFKQVTDRFDLWHKQNSSEAEVKEKRNAVIKLEGNIMTKATDSLFEVCKLSELEKLFEELTEKSVVLKLLMRRKQKIMEDFEKRLVVSGGELEKLDVKELLSGEDCKCLISDNHRCELLGKTEDVFESGIKGQCLWEEAIKYKEILLENFSAFLTDVNSSEQSLLCEKEREVEKKLNNSITQLKQKTTEKSLQVIVNSTKEKLLDGEIERLEEALLEELERTPQDPALNESFSFLATGEPSDDKMFKNLRNYLTAMEMQRYLEFLKEEVKRVEEETTRCRGKESEEDEREIRQTLKAFDGAVEEMNGLRQSEQKASEEISREHGRVQGLLRRLQEEAEDEGRTKAVEEAADKVKSAVEKQLELLLEAPVDVFRTVESSSGRILFECESAPRYLNNYGGELKQFFSAMLIPPAGDLQQILSEVERRKTVLGELGKIISEREKLAAAQRKIQQQLSSIKYDGRSCEKNYKKSEACLGNVISKTEELLREVEFVEKILNNWVEQPYRSMIKETAWGKSLKEAEEKYTKGKIE